MKTIQSIDRLIMMLDKAGRSLFDGKLNLHEGQQLPFTLILADYGQYLVENLDNLGNARKIFNLIEEYAVSDNEVLSVAILTGLIEQLVNASDEESGKWDALVPLLGPTSLAHAQGWIKFTGGQQDCQGLL